MFQMLQEKEEPTTEKPTPNPNNEMDNPTK